MSNIARKGDFLVFEKEGVVTEFFVLSEEHIFFDMIEKYQLNFDLNKGVVKC